MAKPSDMARLPSGTTVQLKRESTIVTGVVEPYDAKTCGPSFPVVYTWNSARVWTISDADECTVVTTTTPIATSSGEASA